MAPFSRFLRYFMTVARLGSIRRAAEELHIAASAIDRQILLGEEQLEVKLFERHPAGLRLTTAGEFLLHAAGKHARPAAERGHHRAETGRGMRTARSASCRGVRGRRPGAARRGWAA